MKAYKLEILIIDHDRLGENGIIEELENANFPNDCISMEVKSIKSADIGEWSDEHPLNNMETCEEEYKKLFAPKPRKKSLNPQLEYDFYK